MMKGPEGQKGGEEGDARRAVELEDSGIASSGDSLHHSTTTSSTASPSTAVSPWARQNRHTKRWPGTSTTSASSLQPGRDYRHPLYLGTWGDHTDGTSRSADYNDTTITHTTGNDSIPETFPHSDLDEPHIKRRFAILKKHPEISTLYGYEWKTKWIALACVAFQLSAAWWFSASGPGGGWHLGLMLAWAWVVGGYVSQVLGLIIHECAHNLAASTPLRNRMVAFLANVAMVFPIAAGFKRHHLEHHSHQGVTTRDPDLPMKWELRLIRSSSTVSKTIWMFFYPLLYVVRGLAMGKRISQWEILNGIWTGLTCATVVWAWGWRAWIYLLLSLWFGYGLHPAAAHFIQEHYVFQEGQETYSYYGRWNGLLINVGLHNEHHDFTKVPWTRLPLIHRIAPEFYETLAHHTSWFQVLFEFLTRSQYGPKSRCARTERSQARGREMLRDYRL